jgi:hypothetical protein
VTGTSFGAYRVEEQMVVLNWAAEVGKAPAKQKQ